MVGARSPWTSDGRKGPEHLLGLIPSCQHKELLPLTCQCSVSRLVSSPRPPSRLDVLDMSEICSQVGGKSDFFSDFLGRTGREALPCVKIGAEVQIDKHQICLLAQPLSPLLGPLFFISTSSWKI